MQICLANTLAEYTQTHHHFGQSGFLPEGTTAELGHQGTMWSAPRAVQMMAPPVVSTPCTHSAHLGLLTGVNFTVEEDLVRTLGITENQILVTPSSLHHIHQ